MNNGQEVNLEVMNLDQLKETKQFVDANLLSIAQAEVLDFDDEEPSHGFLNLIQLNTWINSRINDWINIEELSSEIPW